MAFWSSETLESRIEDEKLIQPYCSCRIEHGAYELSMGEELFRTTDETKLTLDEGQQKKIPAGQIALLLTEEKIRVPDDAIALISIKASIKMRGLINVSGFHVDPGFKGRLKFSVYNAGTTGLHITRGKPMFLIWFVSLDDPTEDTYDGGSMEGGEITDKDVGKLPGEISSPAELRKELEELKSSFHGLRSSFRRLRNAGSAVLIAILSAVLAVFVPMLFEGCQSEQSKETSQDSRETGVVHMAPSTPQSLAPKESRGTSSNVLRLTQKQE